MAGMQLTRTLDRLAKTRGMPKAICVGVTTGPPDSKQRRPLRGVFVLHVPFLYASRTSAGVWSAFFRSPRNRPDLALAPPGLHYSLPRLRRSGLDGYPPKKRCGVKAYEVYLVVIDSVCTIFKAPFGFQKGGAHANRLASYSNRWDIDRYLLAFLGSQCATWRFAQTRGERRVVGAWGLGWNGQYGRGFVGRVVHL